MKTNFYLTDRTERRELDIDKFIDTVCLEFGAEKDRVLSIDRKSELVIVRKVLIFFIQKRSLIHNLPPTLSKTASYFRGETKVKKGGRTKAVDNDRPKNHATVINAVNRHIDLREIGDFDYNYYYIKVEEIFNRLTNFKEQEEKEIMLLATHFFNDSKLIKIGRYIGENYAYNDQLKELLSKDRQFELLSKEIELAQGKVEPTTHTLEMTI